MAVEFEVVVVVVEMVEMMVVVVVVEIFISPRRDQVSLRKIHQSESKKDSPNP